MPDTAPGRFALRGMPGEQAMARCRC